MKNILVLLSLLIFGVTAASTAFAQAARSAFAAVPVPGQPVAPTAPTPIPTPVTPQTPALPRPGPATPATPAKEEQLRIVADPSTNSLIIYSTAQEFQNIKNILKDLDVTPRQVLMDVLVLEVTLSNTESLGVVYQIFGGQNTILGNIFPAQGAVVNPIQPSSPLANLVANLATGFPAGISGIAGRSNAIRAFINALATDNRVKALASPSVLATDNRPARIQVGSEIPILTGQTSTFTGTATPLTSNAIQYRNTGVILTIIPQVNSQGLVNLQVKQEVSAVGVPNFGSTGSPSFTTRDAETTAVVQDGDTLAIGGIIQDQKTRTRSGIPYLMDLPAVGRFFESTQDTTDRTELIILITPHVVRNKDEARNVTEEFKSRLSDVRNELERLEKDRPGPKGMPPPPVAPMKPDITPPPPSPSPVTPMPGVSVPGAPVPAPAPIRPPGVSMAPANPTSVPSPQIAAAMPRGGSTPGPGLPPGASMAPANPPPVASPQVAAAMPLSNTNVVPAQPMPTQTAILSPPPQAERTPEPEPQTDSGGTDRVGALLNSIETNGAGSPNTANLSPAVKPAAQIWVVQVASFVTDKEAQTLASKLKVKGYDANVASAEVGGKTWYRVEVGRLASRNEARELQKNLQVTEKIEQSIISTR